MRVGAPCQRPRRDGETEQPAAGEQRRQQRGGTDREAEHLPAIRLQQHVLHGKAGGAEAQRQQPARPAALAAQHAPGIEEALVGPVREAAGGAARLLLPQGDAVQHEHQHAGALDHLDEAQLAEVGQQRAEAHRAGHHAHQQHQRQQDDHARMGLPRAEVGRQRQPGGLDRVHARADHEEGKRGRRRSHPCGALGVTGEDDQREGHDRQPAELQQRADPDVGHPPPAQRRAVLVGAEADQRPEWRQHQRQRHHERDQRRTHPELDDHHPVQRADQQHRRQPDGDLEQRQPGEARGRRRLAVGEGQEARREARPGGSDAHPRTHSKACDM